MQSVSRGAFPNLIKDNLRLIDAQKMPKLPALYPCAINLQIYARKYSSGKGCAVCSHSTNIRGGYALPAAAFVSATKIILFNNHIFVNERTRFRVIVTSIAQIMHNKATVFSGARAPKNGYLCEK